MRMVPMGSAGPAQQRWGQHATCRLQAFTSAGLAGHATLELQLQRFRTKARPFGLRLRRIARA